MADHDEYSGNPIKDECKDLYGLLLVVDERVGDVGTASIWFVALGALALCVALHMQWLSGLLGEDVEKLRGIWVYILIGVAAFVFYSAVTAARERRVYARFRDEISEAMERNDFDKYTLIAEIQDDPALKQVAELLKTDTAI
jgi:hypothetical protein